MRGLIIWVAIIAGIYAYQQATEADRDDAGAIIGGGDVDAFQMRVGDCFNNAVVMEGTEFSSVPGVPCAEPHDNEVYAVFDLSMDRFPGEEKIQQMAFDGCLQRFDAFVGRDYQSSVLDIMPMFPTEGSWEQFDDREIICSVYDMNAKSLQGSVQGRKL